MIYYSAEQILHDLAKLPENKGFKILLCSEKLFERAKTLGLGDDWKILTHPQVLDNEWLILEPK